MNHDIYNINYTILIAERKNDVHYFLFKHHKNCRCFGCHSVNFSHHRCHKSRSASNCCFICLPSAAFVMSKGFDEVLGSPPLLFSIKMKIAN